MAEDLTAAPPVVLLPDLFSPTPYEWFALLPHGDRLFVLLRPADGAIELMAVDRDGQVVSGPISTGITAYHLLAGSVAISESGVIGVLGETEPDPAASGNRLALHLLDLTGKLVARHDFEVAPETKHLLAGEQRFQVVYFVGPGEEEDATHAWTVTLSDDGAAIDEPHEFGEVTIFEEGSTTAAFDLTTAIRQDDATHVLLPRFTVNYDEQTGISQNRYTFHHLETCGP